MGVLLFVVFIVLPIAELYVIIQVGQLIGVVPTLGLLLASGIAGAYLARSQGRAVWQRFNQAMSSGKVPAMEVFDGAMVIFGGALLLTPGFITDFLGICLLISPGRALVRAMMRSAAARTPTGRPFFFVYDRFGGSRKGPSPSGTDAGATGTPPRRPGPQSRPPASREYDVEGSAREIHDSEDALPSGRDPGATAAEGGKR